MCKRKGSPGVLSPPPLVGWCVRRGDCFPIPPSPLDTWGGGERDIMGLTAKPRKKKKERLYPTHANQRKRGKSSFVIREKASRRSVYSPLNVIIVCLLSHGAYPTTPHAFSHMLPGKEREAIDLFSHFPELTRREEEEETYRYFPSTKTLCSSPGKQSKKD